MGMSQRRALLILTVLLPLAWAGNGCDATPQAGETLGDLRLFYPPGDRIEPGRTDFTNHVAELSAEGVEVIGAVYDGRAMALDGPARTDIRVRFTDVGRYAVRFVARKDYGDGPSRELSYVFQVVEGETDGQPVRITPGVTDTDQPRQIAVGRRVHFTWQEWPLDTISWRIVDVGQAGGRSSSVEPRR